MLLGLFVLRVFGQIVVATARHGGYHQWRGGTPGSCRIATCCRRRSCSCRDDGDRRAGGHRGPVRHRRRSAGTWIVWASYVYALGMVGRAVRYALATPERRGVLIPIVFHFVLAAFLFVWGSSLMSG